jgi:hypothetical protein
MIKPIWKICRRFIEPFEEGYRDTINGIWLTLLAVAWVFLVGTTIARIDEYDPISVIRALTLIGGSAGIYFAIFKFVHDNQWKRSETYLEQATDLIEKAYDVLSVDPDTRFPINDRYRWLSSSRLLLAALELGAKLTEQSHKDTYAALVEYWRVKFRERIQPNGRGPEDEHYYYEKGTLRGYSRNQRAPISEPSVAVIYRFMDWPEGRQDRLENAKKFTDDELSRVRFTASGLYQYCLARRR